MQQMQQMQISKVEVLSFDQKQYKLSIEMTDTSSTPAKKRTRKLKISYKQMQEALEKTRRDSSHLALIRWRIDCANHLELGPYKSVKHMFKPPLCGKKKYPSISLIEDFLMLVVSWARDKASPNYALSRKVLQHIFYQL